MKISYNWLKTYIDVNESPEKVGEWLTDCGLEIEGIEKFETIKGGLEGIFVGEVLSCEKHPDADRLSLTSVSIGQQVLPIVCGAPNVAQGQKVLVATVGATLYPISGDSFQIKKAKIRGHASEGMICAEDELGIGHAHDGIMILPDSAIPGTPASSYFNIENDWIFEIGLTPNRIDAASHVGVARDIAAILNHMNHKQVHKVLQPDVSAFKADNNERMITIEIEDEQACPRYTGLTISGVTVTESPKWLKDRLMSIGLKPINNIVDITNFVLHETGQPLHAFDADQVKGNKIVVRKPAAGTKFITLDEAEKELNGEDLMICDEKDPMCMAGILGGIKSGVTNQTRNIFLESAYFDAATIRKSSRRHDIKTDASFRFERGADPVITGFALKRAALLIKEIAGGSISSEVVDVYPNPIHPQRIPFNFDTAFRLIGQEIETEVLRNILLSLDFTILEEKPQTWQLEIPLYRVDVTREADVVEEILRIYGYNNIAQPEKLHASIVLKPSPDKEKLQNLISDMLSAQGFAEIMNNSLTRAAYFENEWFQPERLVRILNPLSQDLNAMRQSLLFGALETIAYNLNRKTADMKLYEFGNVYLLDDKNNKANKLEGYAERMMLALMMTGNRQPESWFAKDQTISFFDLKATVFQVLKRLGINLAELSLEELHQEGIFEVGIKLTLGKHVLAELGALKASVAKACDIKQEVLFAALEWEKIIALASPKNIIFKGVSKFPEVRRDLALLIDKNIRFSQIEEVALKSERKLLKAVRLFDVYQDAKIGQDKKSYALSFTLQDDQKTLTDKEIEKAMERIQKAIEAGVGASIR